MISLRRMISRILSTGIAFLYLLLFLYSPHVDGFRLMEFLLFFLIPILACIWYAEEMGGYTKPAGFTKASPGCLVAFFAWVVLLLPALWMLVTYLYT